MKGGESLNHIVEANWLKENLSNVRVIDCRFELGNPTAGLLSYLGDHIPGALFFDLNQDMSGKVEEHGGRHPLPNIDEFCDKLSTAGIDQDTTVIAYDDQGGAFASRFWWMLTYLGHKKVGVLNGGYNLWKEENNPVTSEIPMIQKKPFIRDIHDDLLVSMKEVKERIGDDSTTIIDSREPIRYDGIEEPIDIIGGHIPSAINAFWKEGLNDQGTWKSIDEQQNRFNQIDKKKEVIVYCGSGVTACPNVLTLKEVGYENVKLYLGSWSDWITYNDNPVSTNE
ncbi:sulfurtransferase [Chengkuizengella marina]|uniref:Sulfurtransferase n=1 Tax=Chengkuizengella marina TaxID=2507566 RepID=A0A6N9Q130_9BACL|nr:sulfurtransferase [Chengkuizengella marina]NBI27714.1 sulfurtransferase [Chengkuizengella marina]